MVDNFFANSYMHIPGQTIGNIDQGINIVRKKGKGKKGKGKKGRGKGYNNNNYYYYNYNYNHYNTYHNQSQLQKGKSKGKGPIGSSDNNNTSKGKHIKGDKNNKGKGKSTSSTSTSKCWVCGKLGRRAASCWYNNQKNINNVQQQQLPPSTTVSASGLIRPAHRLHASRGHHYVQLPADTSAATTTSTSVSAGTTGTSLKISIICDKSVHTRTSHLRHQFNQQHVRLWRRTTTRHRRTSSLLRHQPVESRTSSRSTSRVTSSLGHPL